MNIWLMNHYATSMFRDKAGRHYWFAKELEKRNNSVTVFCATTFLDDADAKISTDGNRWKMVKDDKTPFVFVKTSACRGNGIDRVKNMGMFFMNLIPSAKQYAKKYGRPDIIVASSVHPLTMIAGILIGKKLKVPCICEVRDLWPEAIFSFGKSKENSVLGKMLITGEHWIYKKADALIFTKEGDTDYLKERGWTTEQDGDIDLKKCHYINNGVNLETYKRQIDTEIFDDEDLNNDCFNITYAGVIRPVNNVGNLLDAAAIIKEKQGYEDIRFLIFGNGSEFEKLSDRVREKELYNVKMKGYVPRKYIPYILSRSSVNILNYSQAQYNWSRGNSSNKLFEYMASGKPVISTVRMGYSIINKYRCGVELEEDTPEKLAEEIMRFYDMPDEEYSQLGANAKAGAEDFDFKVLTDRLEGVIKGVMK